MFIGSSAESYYLVHEFKQAIERDKDLNSKLELHPWTDPDTWQNGFTTINEVLRAVEENELGVFILAHEDVIISRNVVQKLTRPNIWLEIGVFIARRGMRNTFLLEGGGFKEHIPSDLAGIVMKPFFKGGKIDFSDVIADIKRVVEPLHKAINATSENVTGTATTGYTTPIFGCKLILGRRQAYEEGKRMIRCSQHVLFSILSFPEEAVGSEQSDMPKAIEERVRLGGVVVRRWIDLKNEKFAEQASSLLAELSKIKSTDFLIRHTDCRFIEAIIADDEVLLVIPNYSGATDPSKDDRVGLGLWLKSDLAATKFRDWFNALVPRRPFDSPNGKTSTDTSDPTTGEIRTVDHLTACLDALKKELSQTTPTKKE
jgi:hypothetical protein